MRIKICEASWSDPPTSAGLHAVSLIIERGGRLLDVTLPRCLIDHEAGGEDGGPLLLIRPVDETVEIRPSSERSRR